MIEYINKKINHNYKKNKPKIKSNIHNKYTPLNLTYHL